MKTDMEEMMEQLSEMVDPAIKVSQIFFEKIADNTALLKGIAKLHRRLVEEFVLEGFDRGEAINMAIHIMTTLNSGKK
jgi:hypothetical protein